MMKRIASVLAVMFLAIPLMACQTSNAVPGVSIGAGVTETGAVTVETTVDVVGAACAVMNAISESWAERFCPALDPSSAEE